MDDALITEDNLPRICYMDDALIAEENEDNLPRICYMDDALITEETEDNLPGFLYQFFLSAQRYNTKILNSKTNILAVYCIVCILKVQGEVVEQAMSSRSTDNKQ
jgi:hypothetical protein